MLKPAINFQLKSFKWIDLYNLKVAGKIKTTHSTEFSDLFERDLRMSGRRIYLIVNNNMPLPSDYLYFNTTTREFYADEYGGYIYFFMEAYTNKMKINSKLFSQHKADFRDKFENYQLNFSVIEYDNEEATADLIQESLEGFRSILKG